MLQFYAEFFSILLNLYSVYLAIENGFWRIYLSWILGEMLKTEVQGQGFHHLPWDPVNANALKAMFGPYNDSWIFLYRPKTPEFLL